MIVSGTNPAVEVVSSVRYPAWLTGSLPLPFKLLPFPIALQVPAVGEVVRVTMTSEPPQETVAALASDASATNANEKPAINRINMQYGHVTGRSDLSARDDEAAKVQARQVASSQDIEVWRQHRKIAEWRGQRPSWLKVRRCLTRVIDRRTSDGWSTASYPCAPLVRIRTRAPRCTALMGPMAAPLIGPDIRTQAGIDNR